LAREATFRFPDGNAPRIVTHEPRLADGDYVVEIDILSRFASHSTTFERRVTFQGNTTSIDLSGSIAPSGSIER
jgi:hypothetical protein